MGLTIRRVILTPQQRHLAYDINFAQTNLYYKRGRGNSDGPVLFNHDTNQRLNELCARLPVPLISIRRFSLSDTYLLFFLSNTMKHLSS
jgi:hypothetical protein